MVKTILLSFFIMYVLRSGGQYNDSIHEKYTNIAEKLLQTDGKLKIGGYGETHYNQPINKDTKANGTLDVHRMVMLFGYQFNDRVQFISEIEYEHVSEVFIEQAFLQYKLNQFIQIRGGLILIPMGIINEIHEPTTFNGVERPVIDGKISPTTWREIGIGVTGNILPASLKYRIFVVNGFNGYDGSAKLNGSNGLRGGRQKGAESYISSPNFTGKVEFYGITGLNIGLSAYFGKTQSSLYDGIDKNDTEALNKADSSVVGVSMAGVDARYSFNGLQLKGQYYFVKLSNTDQYNYFTRNDNIPNNLGSSMTGYYMELGYNVFQPFENIKTELVPFIRYENYDTHLSVEDGFARNTGFNNIVLTTGLGWKVAQGAVVKADLQFLKQKTADKFAKTFNAGFGIMF